MKKNLLSKLMVCMFVVASMFVVSACGIQKEDVNITSFEIDESSVPNIIVVGEFDKAGIKADVTYSDESVETIDVTTALIPEEYHDELETPGIYKISILFRGQSAELEVRIVANTNLYQVNFYNGKNQLITTEFVYGGETAQLPSETMMAMEGYALTGWSMSNENIMADTNIYGLYVNVENTLSDEAMKEALLKAEQYYITNNHFASVEIVDAYNGETESSRNTINYHYDKEKGIASSQSVEISEYGKSIYIFDETGWEALDLWYEPTPSDPTSYEKMTHEEYKDAINEELVSEGDEPLTEDEYYQLMTQVALTGGRNADTFSELLSANDFASEREVEFSYELTKNKLIYVCTITFTDSDEMSTYKDVETYIIKYDDEKVLQIVYRYNMYHDEELGHGYNETYNIDYTTIEFEELITGDMRVLCDLDLVMQDLVKSDFTLTATNEGDTDTIEYDADNKILKIYTGDEIDVDYMYVGGEYDQYYFDTYRTEGGELALEKYYADGFESEVLDCLGYSFSRNTGGNSAYTVTISVDEQGNNVVSVMDVEDSGAGSTWVFNNEDGLISYNVSGLNVAIDTTTTVNLTVPEDVKALESTATDGFDIFGQ